MNTLTRLVVVSLGSAVIGFTAAQFVPSFAQQQTAVPAAPIAPAATPHQSIAPPAPPAPVTPPPGVPRSRGEIALS